MSIQDKILKKLDPLKRKVYNEKLRFAGNETRIIRLSIETDRFGDEELIELLNHEEITVNLTSMEEIPLSRLREDLAQPSNQSHQGLYLYDILPLEVEPLFGSDLEEGDILIKKMYSEQKDRKPYFLVLRITEPLGSFSPHSMVGIRFQCAPYINSFSQEIVDVINDYYND